ncbi:hypothetical protein C0991_002245 [Blastosporella zonata]|nr:hypothetical protein C0991_002245 [Blastosporella zonata]
MESSSTQTSKASSHFPSPTLVVLSVLSCIVATAATVASFTQLNTRFWYFIVPSTIGFLATIPYHAHMYNSAKAHHLSPVPQSDSIFISNDWIIYNFLLISLWAVVFIINILFCVNEGMVGIIVSTIWSGIQWIILLVLAVTTILEIRQQDQNGSAPLDTQPLLDTKASGSTSNQSSLELKYIYFVSYTLCTLTLVLGIDIHLPVLFTVTSFFLTGPHHIALYIASARPNSRSFHFFPALARPTPLVYTFFLSALWVSFMVVEIAYSRFAYQSILLGIFGGMESTILTYLAVHSVIDSLSDGQIKL